MGSHLILHPLKKDIKRSMFSLRVSLLILLAQTLSPAECQFNSLGGPFHAYADNFGQMYTVDGSGNVNAYGPFIEGVANTGNSVPITPAIPFGAKFLAVIASNDGVFSDPNPAGFLLSSDPSRKSPKIVTNNSWRCKGFKINSISGRDWPTSNTAQSILRNIVLLRKPLRRAATLTAGNFYIPFAKKFVRDISLDAQLIWAADLLPKSLKIPDYVICLRQLRGGIKNKKSG